MAFQQGLSGLNAAATQLDVIGNNIANAGTVGFKASTTQFASLYASAVGGSNTPGIGVATKSIFQNFSQGVIVSSNSPLNMAINGNGFFQISNGGSLAYTRDGQFHVDKNGNVVTSALGNVQGYMADGSGALNTGVVTNLVINTNNQPPNPTAAIGTSLNLNAGSPVLNPASFNPTDDTTYSYSTTVPVFDSLGNQHSLQTYYVNTGVTPPSTEAKWQVFATLDGTLVPTNPVPTLSFTSGGVLDPATTVPGVDIPFNLSFTNGATSPQTVTVAYAGTTQYGSASVVNSEQQDGYPSGKLTSYTIDQDGTITGAYSNNQTKTLGQIALTSFVNPSALQPISNNQWLATGDAGIPIIGTPGTGSYGLIQANAVESSTTDLTAELVNMIQAQQNYQANAKTIQTADQLSQTLFNL